MRTIIYIIPFLLGYTNTKVAFQINGDVSEFSYTDSTPYQHVYLSGNSNHWIKKDDPWKWLTSLVTNGNLQNYIKDVRKSDDDFCEFTFRTSGVLSDANLNAKNAINCSGFGDRI